MGSIIAMSGFRANRSLIPWALALKQVKKALMLRAEGNMIAIWCGLLFETLREQTHTNCRPPVAEILVGDLNPSSVRSL